ncbi:hypothetical protein [Streptomyces chartreusis]|uniref:hypothetical protein n=1 Tax=Streptomyces chartreusis TaxID=1969 RepID=UPI00380D088A
MVRIEWDHQAPNGATFRRDCFDGEIGKTVPLRVDDNPIEAECTLVEAQVAEEGTSVTLTVEVPDGFLPQLTVPPGSFGLR